jgi:hypothetical protein
LNGASDYPASYEDLDEGQCEKEIRRQRDEFLGVGSITTHDAITYSHKAANHRSVFPYLRYGIMLGNRQQYPLPGRLYRHGTQFDFMISFKGYDLSHKERKSFRELVLEEVEASRALEKMIYQSRNRDRDHHALFHRRLTVGDIST